MIYNNLYDLSGLSLLDNEADSVIFTDTETVESVFSSQVKKEFSQIFRAKLNQKFKTGDVVVVSNEDMTVKAYCLITIICGEIVPYVLYYVDMNRGEESIRNFSISDIEMLSAYPALSEPEELIFFLTKLSLVFAENAPADYRKYIQIIKSYLDKGLWVANITWPADELAIQHTKSIMDNMGYRLINEGNENTFVNRLSDISYEKNGQVLSFIGNGIYGPYEEVRKVYCEMSALDGYESMIYNDFFGLLFTDEVLNGQIAKGLIDYDEIVKKASTPKPIERNEEVVVDKIVNVETKVEVVEEDFLSKMDKMIETQIQEDVAKSKSKRKEKTIKSFNVEAEISPEEMALAVKETITKAPIKIITPASNKGAKLNQVSKEKDNILNSPQNSYPIDWDHVYTVGETSKRYNLTYGQKYIEATNSFIEDDKQKDGMTIEDWNAYFISHPELAHLVEETIEHLGGLFKTEQDLMESGHLLYDPKKVRLVYRYEYIRGNVYNLIEELESVKDIVIQRYNKAFYETQMDILLTSTPEMKLINSGDVKKKAFIHPLDEVIVEYKTNTAAGITYSNNLNTNLIRAERKRLEDEIKNKKINPTEFEALKEQFGAQLQSLPITVFFIEWLSGQYGLIAEYGLPDVDMAKTLYFDTLSYTKYADALVQRGLVVPAGKNPTDVVTTSDYFEAKDSAKRFVDDLFQEFLLNEVSQEDRDAIQYKWNKRYNGYSIADVWKLPIFIRHSKYFKNRKNKRKLLLSEVQIRGIKFATIENSSIMAHEVGYGKTLVAIGYMSHCFETAQASNFLISVPKTLYVNRKWKEEVYGLYDDVKDNFIIGATPNYNIIELGNFSTAEIYGGGKKSKYKNYSDDDLDKINYLGRMFSEIGGKEIGRNTSNSVGTATLPTDPYNYKRSLVTSKDGAWLKLINTILPGIDPILFERSKGRNFDEANQILNLLANYDFGTTAKDKATNIVLLTSKIIDIKWYHENHLKLFGASVAFSGKVAYDSYTQGLYDSFENSELSNRYVKEKDGKTIKLDKDGNKVLKNPKEVSEKYILDVLEELHNWIESIIQKMKDFAIYEYGTWSFSTSDKNIILATKECFQNLGFESRYLEGVKNIIEEITTYKNEVNFDTNKITSVTVIDPNGDKKSFKRNPQKVLQKQLQGLLDKINDTMTEEGDRGKFFLSNLKIDGFILDEAHVAKKIFTNVKTDANISIIYPDGVEKKIKTTSHDIKGGSAPAISLAIFSICQYIRSLGNRKPLMLLTATPFSNQPTEIFSMLSLVGIRQLRENGISNIKNFFDLFLKETLKYDFNQNGEFIKRITVEDFRNKEMLINLIWSVMDIRRESTLDKQARKEKVFGDKPHKESFPKLVSNRSLTTINQNITVEQEDALFSECESLGGVSTVAILNRQNPDTSSIVDQNDIQRKMMADIEKVVTKQVNPNTLLEYTFDDFCPNAAIFNELQNEEKQGADGKKKKKIGAKKQKTDEEEERDSVVVTLRSLLNSNLESITGGVNLKDYQEVQNYYASDDFKNAKFGTLVFVKEGFNSNQPGWQLYKKSLKRMKGAPSQEYLELITDKQRAAETIKIFTKNVDYGTTFKALGISRAIALSPYLYRCNDLPKPTPENIVKYSPKIEYLVKALKMVKDYHITEIPKKIDEFKADLKRLQALENPSKFDLDNIEFILKELPQLNAAREVSGQVVYMNMIRFNYYYIDSNGKSQVENLNLADLIIQYLVDKGWFSKDEVKLISSNTSDKDKEDFIKGFQEGRIKVLFGTPAIKEGVDLQNKASTMYIMTPDWNPTDMRQIEGRIWRRDNENLWVRIVYVLLDQSIEVFIYAKLEEKSNRLQKIMKERDTIEELEQMSLNPNEIKVALASDPEKRADIITKLCEAILEDQKNKINRNREELSGIVNNLEKVYQSIEQVKAYYLTPYLEESPLILKRYYDYQIERYVEVFLNAKPLFLDRFSQLQRTGFIGSSVSNTKNTKSLDPIFRTSLEQIVGITDDEMYLSNARGLLTSPINEIYDIVNGALVCIENKDEFVQAINNGSNSLELITQKMPLRYAPKSERVDEFLYCSTTTIKDDHYILRMITPAAILYRMTDDMIYELKPILENIISKSNSASLNLDYSDELANYIGGATSDSKRFPGLFEFCSNTRKRYREYALNHPHLRPENYGPYIQNRSLLSSATVNSSLIDTFDALDITEQIKEIRFIFSEINSVMESWKTESIPNRRDIIKGKNKIPSKLEILVKLGLDKEEYLDFAKWRTDFEAIFSPVMTMGGRWNNIQKSSFMKKGMTLADLPAELEKYQDEYNKKDKQLEELQVSKVRLIEKFQKMNLERKNITVDKIIAQFALTNYYLNYKLQQ